MGGGGGEGRKEGGKKAMKKVTVLCSFPLSAD